MNKRKIKVSDPVVVAQSTTEPVLFGGYQLPFIRCDKDGVLYVKFRGNRKDCPETVGKDEIDPIYRSRDMGQTWEKAARNEWLTALEPLPNGDKYLMREMPIIDKLPPLPPLPENRIETSSVRSTSTMFGPVYTVNELEPLLGDRVKKALRAERIKAGETEQIEEYSPVVWENMPLLYNKAGNYLFRVTSWDKYKVDKNGTMWYTVHGGSVADDGSMLSKRPCIHLLRSDDYGKNWEYVSTVNYKDEYDGTESIYGLEGFVESTLEILDDGSFIMIIRAGSLHPTVKDVLPRVLRPNYFAKSTDQGKTWSIVRPFYDYGIRPCSVKLGCGTIVFVSGRPGVYIRTCDDPKGEEWNDVIDLIKVPEEDIFDRYYEYTCSNCDICAYDDHTAFITYSDFTLSTPDGKRAKSIMVVKITIE